MSGSSGGSGNGNNVQVVKIQLPKIKPTKTNNVDNNLDSGNQLA